MHFKEHPQTFNEEGSFEYFLKFCRKFNELSFNIIICQFEIFS